MNKAGFDAVSVEIDLSSRVSIMNLIKEAQKYEEISMLVNAAGVSPSQSIRLLHYTTPFKSC